MKYNFFFLVVFVFIIVSKISSVKNDTKYANIIMSNHEKIKKIYYNKVKNSCSTNNFFFQSSLLLEFNFELFKDFILFIDEQKNFKQLQFDPVELKKKGPCIYLKDNFNLDNKILDNFDFFLTMRYYEADSSRLDVYNPYYGYGTTHANVNLLKNYQEGSRTGDIIISLKKDEIIIFTMLLNKKYLITKIVL